MNLPCPICEHEAELSLVEGLPAILNRIERAIIVAALKRRRNNRTYAAQDLRIPVHTLRHLVEKHNLKTQLEGPDPDPEVQPRIKKQDFFLLD